MPICNHATGENLCNKCIENVLQSRNIPWCNMIAFNSDTANVMFGKKNSVVSRLKQVQPFLIDLGCICHLQNLCVAAAVKSLPVNIDDLLVDIFYQFHYSVKRKAVFREYQEFCGTQMQCILKHATTRWLSLQRCIHRTISQWLALKSYFLSHEDVEKAGHVKRIASSLKSTEVLLYMHFLDFILGPLNTFNTLFQSEQSKVVVLHDEMAHLIQSILTKFVKARIMKSTKVLNPRRCIMRVYTREIRMRVHENYAWKNGRLYAWPYNGGSAGSLQRSGFRENPTNFLTFVAC